MIGKEVEKMKSAKPSRIWVGWIALVCFICMLPGCASNQASPPPNPLGQPAPSAAPQPQPQTQQAPVQAPAPMPGQRPNFYDFPDIAIPSELDLVSSDSYVFQSGAFKVGLLTLKGRVELNSLISFFQMAMPRENWKAKGGFRYKRSVLIFEKPDKVCVLNLYEKMFYTYVEIYVAPVGSQF